MWPDFSDAAGSPADDETYTAAYLVDLCLDGHYLVSGEIDATVRRVTARFGSEGRNAMAGLPELRAYADGREVDAWLELLLGVEQALTRDAEAVDMADERRYQQEFPWS